ncbi:MAG: hypothetical protein J6A59_09080 [Lachnospiraceae bacterium]|nr:hypothetical protein [Lachnospiraceae bacterium]
MLLKNLLEMQVNGALNIKYDNESTATLGGVTITAEQAQMICGQLGWCECVLHPFELIDKTNKFIRGLKTYLNRDDVINYGNIIFQNKQSQTYGKTFDRIVIETPYGWGLTILYNMEHSGGKYVIYETGKALAIAKCPNLKKVAEFINTYQY